MGRAFSAGADLKEIAEHMANPAMSGETTSREFDELIDTLMREFDAEELPAEEES